MLCERCETNEATHKLVLTDLSGTIEDREQICFDCAKGTGLSPVQPIQMPDLRYRVVNLDSADDKDTFYGSMDEARGGIEYDGLKHWQIWQQNELLSERRADVESSEGQ